MNIKEIKAEVADLIDRKDIKFDMVAAVVDAISDAMFQDGKISDVLIAHGHQRSKKSKKRKL